VHLIIFPFFILLILSFPVLLIWADRGISKRNLALSVGGGMAGLLIGFLVTLVTPGNGLNPAVGFVLMFFIFPSAIGAFLIQTFGDKGVFITDKNAILFKYPLKTLMCFLGANIIGVISSGLAIMLGARNSEFLQILPFAVVMVPVGFICTLVITLFLHRPTLKLAYLFAAAFGFIGLLLLLVSGPSLGLPVIIYTLTTPFLTMFILTFMVSINKPNKLL